MTVDRQTAENDFERFKTAMRLRLDRENMDENDRRDVNEDVEVLISEIMDGTVTVDDEGRITVIPEDTDPLVFSRPKASKLAVIDKKKEYQKVAQQYALIGAFCDTPPSVIKNDLYANELDTCARVTGLFFVK